MLICHRILIILAEHTRQWVNTMETRGMRPYNTELLKLSNKLENIIRIMSI